MVDYLKFFQAEELVGGRFKLAALLQKRIVELMQGAVPLVESESFRLSEIALEEILQGKVTLVPVEELEDELSETGDGIGPEAEVVSAGSNKK